MTDLDVRSLSATVAALLVPFSFAIPFLIVIMLSGWRGLMGIWPAALIAGLSYTIPQYLIARYHGPWLAAPIAGLSCIVALVALLRVWRPRQFYRFDPEGKLLPATEPELLVASTDGTRRVFDAWLPWGILTVIILIWGLPQFQTLLDKVCGAEFNMPWLHNRIRRMPPVDLAKAAPGQGHLQISFLVRDRHRDFRRFHSDRLDHRLLAAPVIKTYWETIVSPFVSRC